MKLFISHQPYALFKSFQVHKHTLLPLIIPGHALFYDHDYGHHLPVISLYTVLIGVEDFTGVSWVTSLFISDL